ncbi:MAG: hypothetical protein NTV23_01900 [Propionibacteriales bacterium]|nr:hypothetical protein [Propionibacteriales bacterium]
MDGVDAGALIAALGGAVAALVVVALVGLLRRRNRTRADLEAMLAAAQRESDDLRARLDELSALLPDGSGALPAQAATYVITSAGDVAPRGGAASESQLEVPDRLVLSATVGQPLVKVAAFGHGVRRALSAESRNRIWFEMRRQVRSSRKRRRAQVREYQRQVRADERAREGLA